MWRLATAVAIGLVTVLIGCGSDDSSSESTSSDGSTAADTAGAVDPLVGEWGTENVCGDQLRAFEQAGLQDYIDEWIGGAEYPGQSPTPGDPCRGAKPVEHSHRFGADGGFASFDDVGQQVDDGSYAPVDDHTLTLGKPPITVRYAIEGDNATFDVVVPECKSKACEESAAYVVSVFFPREYERVD
jgi:hypothetical protein